MTQQEQVKAAKESLLALKKELDRIEKAEEQDVNVFSAAGLNRQEVKHSAFLAWLLCPDKPHGLGSTVLRKMCERLFAYTTVYNGEGEEPLSNARILAGGGMYTLSDLETFFRSGITVETEKVITNKESRIDIFAVSHDMRTVFVIENKVFTSTHDNQLIRYEEELNAHAEYKTYRKILVYLTPQGELPADENGEYNKRWCVFDYKEILQIVREILRDLPRGKSNEKLKILLKDYIELVNTNILKGNKELRSLCKQIRREHKDAIELLLSYTDNATQATKFCAEWLNGHIIGLTPCKQTDLVFAFYTEAMVTYLHKNGENITEKGIARLKCNLGSMNICIGLEKSEQDEWSSAQKHVMQYFAPNKKVGYKYFGLDDYAVELLSADEREQDFESIKPKLILRIEEFVRKLKEFEEKLLQI